MSGITAVYVVFAIVLASIFGYVYLLSRRQRELEAELEDLRQTVEGPKAPPPAPRSPEGRSGARRTS